MVWRSEKWMRRSGIYALSCCPAHALGIFCRCVGSIHIVMLPPLNLSNFLYAACCIALHVHTSKHSTSKRQSKKINEPSTFPSQLTPYYVCLTPLTSSLTLLSYQNNSTAPKRNPAFRKRHDILGCWMPLKM